MAQKRPLNCPLATGYASSSCKTVPTGAGTVAAHAPTAMSPIILHLSALMAPAIKGLEILENHMGKAN